MSNLINIPMYLFEQTLEQMEEKLYTLEELNLDALNYNRKVITITSQTLLKLKELKVSSRFQTIEKEIRFYKEIKPAVLSKLIYFTNLSNIEVKKPNTTINKQINYYKDHLNLFQNYIDQNIEFYHYIKTGNKNQDQHYFTRISYELWLYPETYNYYTDPNFNSSHDTILATLWAYEQLITEVKSEIYKLRRKVSNNSGTYIDVNLNWTSNNIDLIELIYALHCSKAINNGKLNLKDLTLVCEQLFNVEVKNIYRKFLDVKGRKNDQTKFLDSLKKALLNKINESDALK